MLGFLHPPTCPTAPTLHLPRFLTEPRPPPVQTTNHPPPPPHPPNQGHPYYPPRPRRYRFTFPPPRPPPPTPHPNPGIPPPLPTPPPPPPSTPPPLYRISHPPRPRMLCSNLLFHLDTPFFHLSLVHCLSCFPTGTHHIYPTPPPPRPPFFWPFFSYRWFTSGFFIINCSGGLFCAIFQSQTHLTQGDTTYFSVDRARPVHLRQFHLGGLCFFVFGAKIVLCGEFVTIWYLRSNQVKRHLPLGVSSFWLLTPPGLEKTLAAPLTGHHTFLCFAPPPPPPRIHLPHPPVLFLFFFLSSP